MDGVNMNGPRLGRTHYHHGDLRSALLAAARGILDREGVDAVTVRAVAREAGVAHSAPANHFKDRAALLTALAIDVMLELTQEIDRMVEDAGPGATPRKQVEAFARAVMRYGLSHPQRYQLIWRRDSLDARDEKLEASGAAIYDRLGALLKRSAGDGPYDLDTRIIAAWSMAHGYISLRLGGILVAGADGATGESREEAIIGLLASMFDAKHGASG
jgi:AcrR family transcriptional regulator